ncbi:ABC transporter substrate-binding protein [Methyloprofundus sp.]|uniref:ABC transporter substrate-binding protein n=1 Tax=Methyloprofundus sp. TaxID=2020875 RepID=UPI003D0A3E46
MKLTHLFLLLALLAIFSWFMKHESLPKITPSGSKIKVGIIAPFSGVNKGKGQAGLQGIEISKALRPYLKNGDALELIVIDDREDPEQSIKALRELAEEHKVTAIMIFSDSDSVLAVAKKADHYKIPVVALLASHPDITKESSFVMQLNFDDTFQASVAALYVRDELFLDRVAIVVQSENAHYLYLANEFSRQFKEVDGEITDTVTITTVEQDYVKMLQTIKSRDPELLYLPADINYLFEIKTALAELDWDPVIMVSDGIMANVKAQTKYPLSFLDGMLAVDTFSYDMRFTDFGHQLVEQIEAMGLPMLSLGTHSALGMEGYALLVYAMNQCLQSKQLSICINNSIHSIEKFEGIKGIISFDATGQSHRSLVINTIKDNGTMDFIVQVY